MPEWVTAAEWVAKLRPPDLWVCPRCGGEIVPVEGWAEYGDQLVEITRMGCWGCGWVLYEPEDYE